jgi:hypothetical protein
MGGNLKLWLGHWPGSQASPLPRTHRQSTVYPPSVVCVQQEAVTACVESGRLRLLVRVGPVASTWLCGQECSLFPSMHQLMTCWGQKKQNQEEEEHLACHAALPSSPACSWAAGFTRVEFKESQQRQLFSLPSSESLCHHPKSAPSIAQTSFLSLCLLPAAWAVLCPRKQSRERVPYLVVLALDMGMVEPLGHSVLRV